MSYELNEELEAASYLARMAGRAAMSFYGHAIADTKDGGSPVTAADRLANQIIVEGLQVRFPDDAILSEESRDNPERLNKWRVWVVDPLDGTREFLAGVPEFSVMIGLAIAGEAVLGAVYNPVEDLLYTGIVGEGAWIEHRGIREGLIAPRWTGLPLRLVGSRSHPDAKLVRIQNELGIDDVRPSGSVGIKCSLIACGERDLYVHPVPYLKEWDTCAPEAVLRAAGGTVCDCLGEPLQYNKPDPVQPAGILAAAPEVMPAVVDCVRGAFESEIQPVAATH
jgi:3'(2'), 5'-bisphosphate nucleotidase